MIAWVIIGVIIYLFMFGIVLSWYDQEMNEIGLAVAGAFFWPVTLPIALGMAFWDWWS